jgi:hypothetical protein
VKVAEHTSVLEVIMNRFYVLHKCNGSGAKIRKVEAVSYDDMAAKMREAKNSYTRVNVFGLHVTEAGLEVYTIVDGVIELVR